MEKTQSVTLVKGSYNPSDSKDLLLGLINYKRNFHTLKNFSSEVRTGGPDDFAIQRRNELAHALIEVQELYERAKASGLEFKIDCSIEIELTKPEFSHAEPAEVEA